jgi:DNA replication protein DnaC
MRDLTLELKQLRLHGMAAAWSDLLEPVVSAGLEDSRWLIEHLLQAETTDRALRSVSHQMHSAKFPVHRDLVGFDFEISPVDQKLVLQLAELAFTEAAHNAVLVGGPGTGKTRLLPIGCEVASYLKVRCGCAPWSDRSQRLGYANSLGRVVPTAGNHLGGLQNGSQEKKAAGENYSDSTSSQSRRVQLATMPLETKGSP